MATVSDSLSDINGREWCFTFEASRNYAWVSNPRESDKQYPVIDGVAVINGLPRMPEWYGEYESDRQVTTWITQSWARFVGKDVLTPLYGSANIEFVQEGKHGYLTGDYCPLCLKQRDAFEIHHVIFKADGGHDCLVNLLRICCSCHALINGGCNEDRVPRRIAAEYHQLYHFGISFVPLSPPPSGKHKNVHPLDEMPHLRGMLIYHVHLDGQGIGKGDAFIRRFARIQYLFYRGIACSDYPNPPGAAFGVGKNEILYEMWL